MGGRVGIRRREDDVLDRRYSCIELCFGEGQFACSCVRALFLECEGELKGGDTIKEVRVGEGGRRF